MRIFAFFFVVFATVSFASAQDKDDLDKKDLDKKSHYPGIPPLPMPTKQELFAINQVLYLMVMDDVGMLKDPRFDRTLNRAAINKFGPEAIPLMVEWMNYSDQRSWTCPGSILGQRLATLISKRMSENDIDMLRYIEANLGKNVTVKKHLDQFMGVQANTKNAIADVEESLSYDFKAMPFADLMKVAAKFDQPSTKLFEWQLMVAAMAERKNKTECFDYLLNSLEKSRTPTERKALSAALTKSTGKDFTPSSFESLGPTLGAVEQWREWREKMKRKEP